MYQNLRRKAHQTASGYRILGNKMRKHFSGKIEENQSWKENFSDAKMEKMTKMMEQELQLFDYI